MSEKKKSACDWSKDFERNKTIYEGLKTEYQMKATMLRLYYNSMKEAGFNDSQCILLTHNYQTIIETANLKRPDYGR